MWRRVPRFLATPLHRCKSLRAALQLPAGPGLRDFLPSSASGDGNSRDAEWEEAPYLLKEDVAARGRKVYFETYGCQMNVNDSEIAWSILQSEGYSKTDDIAQADVILAVTCSIRENAEKKIWNRLDFFKSLKKKRSRDLPPLKVGLLGCMAERLKTKLLETDKMLDLVAGPDSYRDLPKMLSLTDSGQCAVNVILSLDETYGDVKPVRMNKDSPTAFVSIMRGCENMCSFCIVPFTRGKERSRAIQSIIDEVTMLSNEGVKEVTLLGQNVNSYRDLSSCSISTSYPTNTQLSRGFQTIYHSKDGGRRFVDLVEKVSLVNPEMRIRFTSPHPKDFPDELLHLIRERSNVCKQIHLPAQSGNSEVLRRMRRGYTREAYLDLVSNIRNIIPEATISSDFMTGFCGESEEEHNETVSLMKLVKFDMAYMFAYSMRKKTHAYHQMNDDVPEVTKKRRLQELIDTYHSIASARNKRFIGTHQLALVENVSKRSELDLVGRMDGNIKVIFPGSDQFSYGDYVIVKITGATSISLQGVSVQKSTLQEFNN